MKISESIRYIGVNDHELDLFEGQYLVPNGMSYNSYVILDEKIAVMDAVDGRFTQEWLDHLELELGGREPDYLVIQHMEPDHSAGIPQFLKKFPRAQVVATAKAFIMMEQFFPSEAETEDFAETRPFLAEDRKKIAENGGSLELGNHTLQFYYAPMVHWPEVMMTYEQSEKTLFSADGFGKFGALDVEEDWLNEARRYYIGIVAKYGAQVQAILKKAACLEIEKICSLHGPVLQDNLSYYLDCYQTWSSYEPESRGIVIAYASVYGNTKAAAQRLAEELQKRNAGEVILHDLARDDKAQCIADAFQYDRLVLAGITYNGDLFPCMRDFMEGLLERNYQNRTVALIENGSWAPMAGKVMRNLFEKSKNITFAETEVKLLSAMNQNSIQQIAKLAEELCGK